ncbi:MAG: hypothetical protein E3J67_00040 [Dehalococcoidia bacterium]|nr:MAG: hypothetical protein E3J67_00040 [Dehalococcoidia bacterium]
MTPDEMRCAAHPGVETRLKCAKCGKPICPKCLVQTLVGARCPDCARLYKLPTYSISSQYYLRASAAALAMAAVGGIVWGVIEWVIPIFSFNLLLAPGVGYGIGEVVSLSVNRKRGTGLAAIAGLAIVISYIVSLWFISFLVGTSFYQALPLSIINIVYHLLALALGIFFAVNRLR